MFPIADLLPQLPRLKIVDVGAMTLGDGTEPYTSLMKALPCEVIGFEPIQAECDKLNAQAKPHRKYLPYFIGDGSAQTFYECNMPMTSSLFEPNTELLDKFHNLENLTRVVKTHAVQTKRLDDIPELAGTDYLKVDVQGGELLVYLGGPRTLADAAVVHTEIEFVPMYKNQPLFADIDAHLRSRGFALHRIPGFSGRTFKPLIVKNDVNALLSQIMWADAVYVRDFMNFDRTPPAQLLKIAAILHENYRSYDLAAYALGAHDRQTGGTLQPSYLNRLTGRAPAKG
ncbi:MAG: FkbM family methyltransferase [Alphaproteobacteria bacterium]